LVWFACDVPASLVVAMVSAWGRGPRVLVVASYPPRP